MAALQVLQQRRRQVAAEQPREDSAEGSARRALRQAAQILRVLRRRVPMSQALEPQYKRVMFLSGLWTTPSRHLCHGRSTRKGNTVNEHPSLAEKARLLDLRIQ